MKKTNKKIGRYLIAPIVSLFTLVTIGASIGFSSSGSLNTLGNNVNKARMESAESYNVLKGDDVQIEIGTYHSAAVVDGKLFMWGDNSSSQLGISGGNRSKPTYVDVDGDKNPDNDNVISVALGEDSSMVINDGKVYSWGGNYYGQLGRSGSGSTPGLVELSGTVKGIYAGYTSAGAITSTGTYTWGNNECGQLGVGVEGGKKTIPTKITIPGTPTQLSFGQDASGFLSSSNLYVAGWGYQGRLGLGPETAYSTFPTPTKLSLPGTVSKTSFGVHHAFAITSNGLYAWGYNVDGQLGFPWAGGWSDTRWVPELVPHEKGIIQDVSALWNHSLFITSTGVYSAGQNRFGELGTGNLSDSEQLIKVVGISGTPKVVSAGAYYSAALTSSGIYMWGLDEYGRLGLDGPRDESYTTAQLLDYSSNKIKELNILDLTASGVDLNNLKNKKVDDVSEADLLKLFNDNKYSFYEEISSDAEIKIKSIERFGSYLDKTSGKYFGKIEMVINNNKQWNIMGPQDFVKADGEKYLPGNENRKISITKFVLDEESFTYSDIAVKENPTQDISIDDFVEKTKLESSYDMKALEEYFTLENFPSTMSILGLNNIKKNHKDGKIDFDLTIRKYNKISAAGDFQEFNGDKTYTVSLKDFNIPSPTESKLFENYPKDLTVQELAEKLAPISADTAKIKKELEKTVDFGTYHKDSVLEITNIEQLNSTGILNFKINTSIWINDQNQKVKSN
ncbi:MAG: RCC1 domain-containing protein, partial [Mycoplasma sp.]